MKKTTANFLLRGGVGFVFASSLALVAAPATPAFADAPQASSYQGMLQQAVKAEKDKSLNYVAYVTFNDGVTAKITFLEPGIFRYNVDPSGEFSNYAAPRSKDHVARIQAQPDSSPTYSHPEVSVKDTGTAIEVSDGTVTISFNKSDAKMTIKSGDKVVFQESEALSIAKGSTTQSVAKTEEGNFYGGGMQNGRFLHTGDSIEIANTNNWNDGGVASPNPFYWTSEGYGVLRNTFAQGTYDFGKTDGSKVTATHGEYELDAYYFVADAQVGKSTAPIAQDMLQAYYKVTGNPILLPEYAFYVGNYNAYNRDMWSAEPKQGYREWLIKGHAPSSSNSNSGGVIKRYEKGGTGTAMEAGSLVETLNGTGPKVHTEKMPEGVQYSEDFSARTIVDEYQSMDMPFGYMLVNDGYGAGYGQNGYNKTGGVEADGSSSAERLEAVAANVDNLREFSDYANVRGVHSGLWTQSNLTPDSNPNTPWHLLRDFEGETAKGGITTLKTDVAWVGAGYSFGLNGTKFAYDTMTKNTSYRPNIVSLDGWAGSQRYAAIWSGDQYGGNWDYIRFHIPTFVGQGLSGNPNATSDMDGIFGGHPIIATRDYQWKSFTSLMMDMDGWGSYMKAPYTHGDPYTGINRMYLKLKSQLMPYIYTSAASAANIDTGNGDTGLPFTRAMMFSDDSAFAASEATAYQFTLGEDILVAPIYQNSDGDGANGGIGDGNDIRNGIYLPGGTDTIWIDYWTGKQYRGGQVINNFDAPIWKLPVFVKANAILPMYEPNNNPQKKTDQNPGGLDRTKRIVEFFATAGENSYSLYEDNGASITNNIDESDEEYGKQTKISYGDHVTTKFTSQVSGETATFTAAASTGSYEGYDSNRETSFVVNLSKKPSKVTAKNGEQALEVVEVSSKEDFDRTVADPGKAVVFYNEKPNLNYNAYAADEAVRNEGFSKTEIATTPKMYVKFAKTDVSKNAQALTVEGFANDGNLPVDGLNRELAKPQLAEPADESKTPTSITLSWQKDPQATSYELKVDGTLYNVGDVEKFVHDGLAYNSTHTYQLRSRNADGYSEWSDEIRSTSLEDPWRNVPIPAKTTWEGGYYNNQKEGIAFDHDLGDGHFHSDGNNIGQALTIDYGRGFTFDTFEYYPRTDGGNGTVTKMKFETSLDGVHWSEPREFTWERNGDKKTENLNGIAARYIRLTPLQSVGNFFSARELAFYKKDGTDGFEIGSIVAPGEVNDGDYQSLKNNALGLEDRADLADDFDSHVGTKGGDVNMNGIYDAYDIAFTMSKLDGGTKQSGKVAGNIAVVPSKTQVEAGETITVDLYATDAENVNAFGSVVHLDSTKFEFVKNSITGSAYAGSMENLSIYRDFSDGKNAVNITFANRGDGKLYAGTGAIASFQIKAKKAGAVELPSRSYLVGPGCDGIEVVDDGSVEFPDQPETSDAEYAQDAFDITITNEALPTDDGGNVGKMIQGGSYGSLFDNVKHHDGGSGSGTFELKWATETPEVSVPLDVHFAFKTPSPLKEVVLFNRQSSDGTVSGNGVVKKLGATVTFEDGTKQEFTGGQYDAQQAKWTFAIDQSNLAKTVKNVDIHVKETSSKHMMTISEIDFNYTNEAPTVEGIQLDEGNAKQLYVGDLSQIKATVTPEGVYGYFTAESSDPSVASISQVQSGEDIVTYVRGNRAGKATITVASKLDPTKTASYEIEVKEGVDVAPLRDAVARGKRYHASAYTEDSYRALASALDSAEALLDKPVTEITRDDVARAVVDIDNAIDGLKMRPIDEGTLLNGTEGANFSVVRASSSASESPAENALDGSADTFWHSNYSSGHLGMPQHLIFDLGAEYDITDMTFLPRQDGQPNGDIFEAEILVGASIEDLEAQAASRAANVMSLGTFSWENDGRALTDRDQYKQAAFAPTKARYVMFKVNHAGGQQIDQYASAAEFRFYGTKHEEPSEVDKSALRALVDQYREENLKAEDYTIESWRPYELALADAERLLADTAATQIEVNQCIAALRTAHDSLVRTDVPPVENPTREQLEQLLAQAKMTDTSGKTPASAQALKDAIAYAEHVLSDPASGNVEFKAAYDGLRVALDGLEDVAGGGSTGGGTAGGGSTGGSPSGRPTDGGSLVQTGDSSIAVAAATGLSGVAAAIAGLFARRKRR